MAKIEKKSLIQTYTKLRGWGTEFWIENMPEYCGKILVVSPNKKGSLHFHKNKMETMLVQQGNMRLRLIDPADGSEYFQDLEVDDSIKIPQAQVHQICAGPEGCTIIEFSTIHEEDDSYRVQKGD